MRYFSSFNFVSHFFVKESTLSQYYHSISEWISMMSRFYTKLYFLKYLRRQIQTPGQRATHITTLCRFENYLILLILWQQQNLPCFCRRRTRPWRHRVDGTWQSSGACSTWEWRLCVCTAHKLPQDFVAGQSQRSWVHHSPSRKPRPTTVHSSDAPTCLRRNSEVWNNNRLIFSL